LVTRRIIIVDKYIWDAECAVRWCLRNLCRDEGPFPMKVGPYRANPASTGAGAFDKLFHKTRIF
jgi:hypothetical protein